MDHESTALPVRAECTDTELLETVIAFYRERLKEHPPALAYLQDRGLTDPGLLDVFELGYADRALSRALPHPQLKAGKRIRQQLRHLGILRPTGHGHFNGCIVVPIRAGDGVFAQGVFARGVAAPLYGRKISRHLKDRNTIHVISSPECLPLAEGGSGNRWGLFNAHALQATDEVILTDSVINGLTFWSAGLRNVAATLANAQALGTGFTDEHLKTFQTSSVRRVLLAYRNTDDGNKWAEAAAKQLTAAGQEVIFDSITFPPGLDANDYCLREGPESLATLVRQAERNGKGAPVTTHVTEESMPEPSADARAHERPANKGPAPDAPTNDAPANDARAHDMPKLKSTTADASATDASSTDASAVDAEVTETDVVIRFADRRYRIRGLGQNNSLDRLKINLLVSRDGLIHADTLDLYAARSRNAFIKQASGEIYIEEETIRRDLAKILLKLETLQEEQIQQRLSITKEKDQPTMTDAEREEALELLHDPCLMDRIVADYRRCGLVGEETNVRVSYLACVSRRLPEPLAVMIQSGSGSGKTALMDATLAFMPPEDRIQYSAMTGQSLYYMGPRNMKHKILAVSEEEGVSQAAYALKLLQSDGRLRIASAEKDGDTGRQKTQDYEVEGPVMMFLTTTAQEPDPELQNRCLTLRVNESEEQTNAIHARQRAAYTLAGQRAGNDRQAIQTRHQNAQRLLEARTVIIPWADELTFRRDQASMRRDHAKYLSLIAAITLLHQYQRPPQKKSRPENSQTMEYIESTLDDIETANRLAGETLGRALDSLLPQTRQLLVLLNDYVGQRCKKEDKARRELRFKQREARDALGWSDFALRKHLARLVELEYVLVYRTGRGNEREYQLVYDGEGRDGKPFLLGLIDVEMLKSKKTIDKRVPIPPPATNHEPATNTMYDNRNERPAGRNEPHSSPIRAPIEPQSSTPKNGATPCNDRQLQQETPIPSKNGTQTPKEMCAS